MKTYKIYLTDSAFNDLDMITDYLLEKNPHVALKTYNEIMDSYKQLGDFPLSGSYPNDDVLTHDGYRKLVCGNYISLYRVVDDTVYIYHIFHYAQNYVTIFKSWVKDN